MNGSILIFMGIILLKLKKIKIYGHVKGCVRIIYMLLALPLPYKTASFMSFFFFSSLSQADVTVIYEFISDTTLHAPPMRLLSRPIQLGMKEIWMHSPSGGV